MAPIRAAEIKVIASNGVKEALHELAPPSSARPGTARHLLRPRHALKRQIEAGEAFDSPSSRRRDRRAREAGQGRRSIAPRHRALGVGIGIKKGAPRPDIRTPGAFKRTLLSAKSITWAKEGQSGIYFASLLERIGIAEQMKSKAVPALTGVEVANSSPAAKPSSASSSSTN